MAKMKRMRQKLHNAAQRTKDKDSKTSSGTDQDMTDSIAMPPPPPPADPTALCERGENLFKDVKIGSFDLVTQKLPDWDARSSITSKTFKGKNLTKKEKRKLRHNAWMAKIDHIQTVEKKAKESKKKDRTPIIGNIDLLMDALPTLELLMKTNPKQSDDKEDLLKKVKSTLPERRRKKQMKKDMSMFKKVSKHPLFREDAKRTITEHLKIAVEKEVI